MEEDQTEYMKSIMSSVVTFVRKYAMQKGSKSRVIKFRDIELGVGPFPSNMEFSEERPIYDIIQDKLGIEGRIELSDMEEMMLYTDGDIALTTGWRVLQRDELKSSDYMEAILCAARAAGDYSMIFGINPKMDSKIEDRLMGAFWLIDVAHLSWENPENFYLFLEREMFINKGMYDNASRKLDDILVNQHKIQFPLER